MEKEFLNFCKEKIYMGGIVLTIVLSYGLLVARVAIGIDDESMDMYLYGGELIRQDRIGWIITNKFFSSYTFLPWFTSLLGIVLFTGGILLWLYGLDKELNSVFSKGVLTVAGMVNISFPYIAKFAIFNGNMIAMGYVMLFTSIALYISYKVWDQTNIRYILTLFFCISGVFLFEKAYIVLFCQGVAFFALMKRCLDKNIKVSKILKWIFTLCITMGVSFLIAKGIIFMVQRGSNINASDYTSSYIKYDITSLYNLILSIRNFVGEYATAILSKTVQMTGERVYVFSGIVMLILTAINVVNRKDIFIALLGVGNIFLSATVYFVTGNIYLPYRVYCFNYAFFIGMSALFLGYVICKEKAWKKKIYYLVYFLIIGNQCKAMEQIYYQKYITFEKDKRMAELVIEKVENECGKISAYNKPIIFMGFPNDYNINYSEVEESSLYIWDRNSSTASEETSRRIYNFFEELGYLIKKECGNVDYYEVRKRISSMSSFPEDGCVEETDEYIIVKLGDSLCEILDENEEDWKFDESLFASIELLSCENNMLSLKGWLIRQGYPSFNNNISLILSDGINQYKIRIDEYDREDVSNYIGDGINYNNCGFNVNMLISDYVNSGNYEVYLELVEKDNRKYMFDCGQKILIN